MGTPKSVAIKCSWGNLWTLLIRQEAIMCKMRPQIRGLGREPSHCPNMDLLMALIWFRRNFYKFKKLSRIVGIIWRKGVTKERNQSGEKQVIQEEACQGTFCLIFVSYFKPVWIWCIAKPLCSGSLPSVRFYCGPRWTLLWGTLTAALSTSTLLPAM